MRPRVEEAFFKKKKKSSYNFMNLRQINRQGSHCVAQWTFHVPASQGRCVWRCVRSPLRISGKAQANTHRHACKITMFLFFCEFTAHERRTFLPPPHSLTLLSLSGKPRTAAASKSSGKLLMDNHPGCTRTPASGPALIFYYRRITISRLPTPPWDFATVL